MNTTPLVVFIFIIGLGIYDLACVVFKGVPSSVSAFIVKTTKVSPIISFVFGAVVGHLFFNMCGGG